MKKKFLTAAVAVLMSSLFAFSAIACSETEHPYDIEKRASTGHEDSRVYTMNDYTSQMPSQWCTIFNSDSTNRSAEDYMISPFYEFDYQYDADGNIIPGGYTLEYSAATSLKDVTAKYAGQYGIPESATSSYAFAMTLREGLTWDDGVTPIKAEDFVWTMKQQLSPKYLFDTASNYYSGNYIIHNAQNYLKQGQTGWFDNGIFGLGFDKLQKGEDDVYKLGGYECYITVTGKLDWLGGDALGDYVDFYGNTYFDVEAYTELKALGDEDGKIAVTDQSKELLKKVITYSEDWGETEEDIVSYMFVNGEYPEMEYDGNVGFFVGENELEIVVVMDNYDLKPIDAEGNLTYEAGYYFGSWPLVKKSLWEACEDSSKGVPYSNSYCTSIETSASWGPYKMSYYQDNKTYTISRNENWYGYDLPQYAGQYQTDQIITQKITEWDTAWELFQAGAIDGIGMDVKIAQEYRNSRQAYFTPETWTYSLNVQSMAKSHTETRNNLLLNYGDFRQAISLALDRDDYCAKNNPSSLGALGLLNNMYYYDVVNGKIYRDTVQAKEAILYAYGATKSEEGVWTVGQHEYEDIDEALDAMTGYNLTLARQLVDKAVDEAIDKGDYVEGENVVLTYGIETQSANTDRVKKWFQDTFDAMTKGTKLEGKVKIEYFFFSSATWNTQFKNGEYDLCFGAWGSAAFNPAYLLCETQIGANNRYAKGWDPTTVEVTVSATPDEDHEDGVYSYNLDEWREILQGKNPSLPNFKRFPIEDQLAALGAVETAVLQAYYSIPVFSSYAASLMGYKADYVSYDYNTFMGYGGIRYMAYNFDDTEWAAFVAEHGTLNYKFGK